MRAGLCLRYSSRSLFRDGYRTVLALFCIAVGVMAIVSLQLAALTIRHSLTSNLREANGGDLSLQSFQNPLTRDDLKPLDDMRRQGLVDAWTPVMTTSVTVRHAGGRPRPVSLQVVEPSRFPLVGRVKIGQPAGGELGPLISRPGTAVIDPLAAHQLGASLGDQLEIASQDAAFKVTVSGIMPGVGGLAPVAQMMVGAATYEAATPTPVLYDTVQVTTAGRDQMLAAQKAIQGRYPVATVRTTDDLLKSQRQASDQISRFLQVVGLLALLVGGIGIANTMQVLLSRRRTEIAMLKTAGYRKRDLYALFGLEAFWLGLVGGVLGALGGAVLSVGVSRLVENLVNQHLEPQLDRLSIISGAAVGVATALTFGVLPIVKAAQVRPLAVLREARERGWRQRLLTAGLLILLGLMFTSLAFAILRDASLALIGVAGTLAGLGLLAAVFALVGFLVQLFPVPERLGRLQLLVLVPMLLVAAAVTYLAPAVGVLLLLLAAALFLLALAPARWKATARLGLRGVGRQPSRTATTLVALFVGVFCVGSILILGLDIRAKLDSALSNRDGYNVVAFERAKGDDAVARALPHLPGLKADRKTVTMATVPVAVRGDPVADFAARAQSQQGPGDPNAWVYSVTSIEGSNLGQGELPKVTLASDPDDPRKKAGRPLTAADRGTQNILGGEELLFAPWNLRPGDTLTMAQPRSHLVRTLTLVGFYSRSGLIQVQFGVLKSDSGLVSGWAGSDAGLVYSLKVDPARKQAVIDRLADEAPAALVLDIADFGAIVDQILRNLLILLTALASLALLAGTVIIANAVALSMLERRREIGIMKSLGFASKSVLAQVLFENALLGTLGGLVAIAAVAAAMALLGKYVFQTSLEVGFPLAAAIVVASGALAGAVAGLVAWAPTRVRPLEVLRYE